MIKILGGDWPEGKPAFLRCSFLGKPEALGLHRGPFAHDLVRLDEIESVDLVTQENKASIAGKLGWGAVGALALGPLGLLAGVLGGGNKSLMMLAVKLKDGRAVLLQGKSKEMQPLLGAAFTAASRNRAP